MPTANTHFTVTQQPSSSKIISGIAVTFQINYEPQFFGTFTDTVTIENNDSSESTYNFMIASKKST